MSSAATHTHENIQGTIAGMGPGENGLSQGSTMRTVAANGSL